MQAGAKAEARALSGPDVNVLCNHLKDVHCYNQRALRNAPGDNIHLRVDHTVPKASRNSGR